VPQILMTSLTRPLVVKLTFAFESNKFVIFFFRIMLDL